MKKKVLAVLLGGCMVAGLLAGCGGGGDDAKTSDDGSKDSGTVSYTHLTLPTTERV